MLKAGELRHRLTIQRYTVTKLVSGQEEETYNDEATVSGSIKELGGGEKTYVDQTRSIATKRIRIRFYAGLSAKDRFKYIDRNGSTRYFGIVYLYDWQERGIFHDCDVKEVTE